MFFINREQLKNSSKPCLLKVLSLANGISTSRCSNVPFIEKYELVSRQTDLENKYHNNIKESYD